MLVLYIFLCYNTSSPEVAYLNNKISPGIPVNALAFSLILQLALRIVMSLPAGYIADGIVLRLCEALLYIISLVLPAVVFLRMSGQNLHNIVSFKNKFPPHPFLSACAVLAVIIAAGFISDKLTILLRYLGLSFNEKAAVITDASAFYYIVLFIVTVPLPAIIEELVYRGLILGSLSAYNRIFAVLSQALLFGILHGNPGQFLYTVCGGLFLGILTLECGSVKFAVIVHLINNALAFFYLCLGIFAPGQTVFYTVAICVIFAAGIIGIISLILRISEKLKQYTPPVPSGSLLRIFITSPPMLLYIVSNIILLTDRFRLL
jgi:membrane protease YdiL (CAAX protease family)